MSWSMVGWGIIAIAFVLLLFFTFFCKNKEFYRVRKLSQVDSLKESKIAAIEGGLNRFLVLGHQFSTSGYPGLGLNSLAALPGFLDVETLADGKLSVSASDGSLVVFARQIIENRYEDGVSLALAPERVQSSLFGPTVYSYTAGLLCALSSPPQQNLILTGHFGPESSLWSEFCESKKGSVFALAGTIASQASLFVHTENLLIGEESFLLPGLINPGPCKTAGWVTEDILRILLMLTIIAGAILKMAGVL